MPYDVLIVDDSRTSRGMLKRLLSLSRLPWGVFFEAENGEAALALLRQYKVDLVLADLNMPVMDGPEMIRILRSDPRIAGTPVLVVSAEGDPAVIEVLRKDGVLGVLRKPFEPSAILALLEQALAVESVDEG
jgi:two-component system chemotaxis response regulator CheY